MQNTPKSLYYMRPGLVVGLVVTSPKGGYRYVPFTTAQQPSRKDWPTPEDAIRGRASGGRLVEAVNFKHAQQIATQE